MGRHKIYATTILKVLHWSGLKKLILYHLKSEWKYFTQNTSKLCEIAKEPMVVDKRNAHSGVCVYFSHQAAAVLSQSIQSSQPHGQEFNPVLHTHCWSQSASFMCKMKGLLVVLLTCVTGSTKLKHCIFGCLLSYLGLQFLRLRQNMI